MLELIYDASTRYPLRHRPPCTTLTLDNDAGMFLNVIDGYWWERPGRRHRFPALLIPQLTYSWPIFSSLVVGRVVISHGQVKTHMPSVSFSFLFFLCAARLLLKCGGISMCAPPWQLRDGLFPPNFMLLIDKAASRRAVVISRVLVRCEFLFLIRTPFCPWI